MNVLLVDKDEAFLAVLTQVTADEIRPEMTTRTTTEEQALDALAAGHYDLIIAELQLNQGTAFGVMRNARNKKGARPTIIVFTNHAVPALKVASFEAGADYFFDKQRNGLELIIGVLRELRTAAIAKGGDNA